MIPIGSWQPDVAKTTAGITNYVLNAMPIKGDQTIDWAPMAGLSSISGAGVLPEAPKSVVTVINKGNGGYETYAGTATSLYKLGTDYTWTQIGTGYNLPEGDYWSFEAFGQFLLATNTADGLLAYNMVTPAGVNAVSGAPKFRSISAIFDTLMGFSSDGDTLLSRNSAINDFTTWTPGTNGANYQPYPDGDELVFGIELPGGVAVVFQGDRYNVLLRNDQLLYTKAEQSYGVGAIGHQCVVKAGGKAYFHSGDGFYATGGGAPEPIGAERVNRYFLTLADQAFLSQMQGTYDNENKCVRWRFKTVNDSVDGVFSGQINHDIQLDQWFLSNLETAGIFAFRTPGIAVDDVNETIDSVNRPLDSRYWTGGAPALGVIGSDLMVHTLDGPSLAATLETQTSVTPTSQLISSVTPFYIGDQSALTVQIGATDFMGNVETWSSARSVQRSGRVPVRHRGKDIKVRMNFAAGTTWTSARGVDFITSVSGGPR